MSLGDTHMSFAARATSALAAVTLTATVAACSSDQEADSGSGWNNQTIYAASKAEVGSGVAAVTALRNDRTLETAVLDLNSGEQLWDQSATMVGRLAGLGVQPPAVIDGPEGGVVVAVEPGEEKKNKGGSNARQAILVARDARNGTKEWSRPIHSSFGPTRCGQYVCVSERTALQSARFVVLDPTTGKAIWRVPGIAEVEYADDKGAVLLTMDDTPTLQYRNLQTGGQEWELPLADAVGGKASLAGGWDFTPVGDSLVGYLGPYQESSQGSVPGYGYFAVKISDGSLLWKRQQMVRLYPSPKPSSLLLARRVAQGGKSFGGFLRLDPRTGRDSAQISSGELPKFEWWLGFSADLRTLAFLASGRAGTGFDLGSGRPVKAEGRTAWSYCTRSPQQLPIEGHDGFYPAPAVCEFDIATGEKQEIDGPPPKWITGATDGWRVWRDEAGALHGVRDGSGTSLGMYG
ncbi:MAG: PQQ-binding-like beta-propeller repeat protein [Streptosporangiales bacterium]|nr:PQQ-binding-like beta-propeller repeat protein [Streptosporangiales bacterium]